ncbi:hypothetical protein PP651_gp57 [Aeromonas phage ZPAH14]|uniref:Uncharacterized protein n=1 Tax=Aeromonas phage ZPAH14 TaxID=2924887 RepID=A0AAE9GZR5_9CAUD|nr:hypothetical protein PP651_gp57 [Aeromonas phage ZPAH14]UOT58022.1 hypothetical protein [Aeromonas phage ZPAH14]
MALFVQATDKPAGGSGVKMDAPLLENGGYPARLLRIVDLGEQPGSQQYPNPAYKMALVFECLDEFMHDEEGKELEDQPRIFDYEVSYNLDGYMSEKSSIHKVMKALDGFGVGMDTLLGKACTISLIQKATKSDATKLYNKVTGVTAMRSKDAERYGPLQLESYIFNLDASATKEAFEKLSTRGGEYSQQSKIKASLSLHKDAPQLAEALGIEKLAVPENKAPVDDVPSAEELAQSDADLEAAMGGAVPAEPVGEEDDPFA